MKVSISREGAEIGEWPSDMVKAMYEARILLDTDHYWKPGMEHWEPLWQIGKPPVPAKQTAAHVEREKTIRLRKVLADCQEESDIPALTRTTGIGRLTYLGITMVQVGIGLVLTLVIWPQVGPDMRMAVTAWTILLNLAIALIATYWRLKNANISTWWCVAIPLPVLGWMVMLYCLIARPHLHHQRRS
jgi:hypothetical protein